jgi:hypothetical protein
MRRWLAMGLLLSAIASAQTPPSIPIEAIADLNTSASGSDLPDAPSVASLPQEQVIVAAKASFKLSGDGVKTCNFFSATKVVYFNPKEMGVLPKPCTELIYPYQKFLDTNVVIPMTWQQKGYFALHNLVDPASIGTILGISAITIATNAHTAYGPGLGGWGELVGISLVQDATGQFFGIFAIPSLVHQDPRYFRMGHGKVPRRFAYAVSRSFVAQSDAGKLMPNYAVILSYPIVAEINNLYVPGIHPDAASTLTRIGVGYLTDPANNLLTEFLPDVASHIQIRIIFVQRLLNNIAAGAELQ